MTIRLDVNDDIFPDRLQLANKTRSAIRIDATVNAAPFPVELDHVSSGDFRAVSGRSVRQSPLLPLEHGDFNWHLEGPKRIFGAVVACSAGVQECEHSEPLRNCSRRTRCAKLRALGGRLRTDPIFRTVHKTCIFCGAKPDTPEAG